ncbi:hypothetical protein Sjap_005736 [Stephania japonica]|uniref:Uncharacterized protein n=1 Tax=Stephania japonica TaxID=461633 RepID=A0AAP0K662_9MAGN
MVWIPRDVPFKGFVEGIDAPRRNPIFNIKWHKTLNSERPKLITTDSHIVRTWDPKTQATTTTKKMREPGRVKLTEEIKTKGNRPNHTRLHEEIKKKGNRPNHTRLHEPLMKEIGEDIDEKNYGENKFESMSMTSDPRHLLVDYDLVYFYPGVATMTKENVVKKYFFDPFNMFKELFVPRMDWGCLKLGNLHSHSAVTMPVFWHQHLANVSKDD